MLSYIHSRKVAHDLLVLGVLGLETFFAWRASLMYVFVLTGRVSAYELDIVRWLVFLAVGVFGFALATHRYAGIEAIRAHQKFNWTSLVGPFIAVLIVVTHDVAATIYTVGAIDNFGTLAAIFGMCGLAFLPFLVGFMSHAIAAGIEKENDERNQRKINGWREAARLRFARQYYRQLTFTPEMLEGPARQERALVPEVVSEPEQEQHNLAQWYPEMFSEDNSLVIRSKQNGNVSGKEAAKEDGEPFPLG